MNKISKSLPEKEKKHFVLLSYDFYKQTNICVPRFKNQTILFKRKIDTIYPNGYRFNPKDEYDIHTYNLVTQEWEFKSGYGQNNASFQTYFSIFQSFIDKLMEDDILKDILFTQTD